MAASLVLLSGFLLISQASLGASQEVDLRIVNDHLQVSAPGLHFLAGKPLEQLRNGASVAFDIQISILGDSRQSVLHRSFDRFVLSYDIWEEKFSIARMRSSASGGSASHLSASAAEAWCVRSFVLPLAGLPQNLPLWVRIDVRANEGRERRPTDDTDDQTFSLTNLIDIFSRPARGRSGSQSQWRAESSSFLLANLNKGVR